MSESVSWFASISSLFCLFRLGVGLSAELELDERSERFNMGTSSKQTIVLNTGCTDVKNISLVAFERTLMARYDSSQLRNHRARRTRPSAMIPSQSPQKVVFMAA